MKIISIKKRVKHKLLTSSIYSFRRMKLRQNSRRLSGGGGGDLAVRIRARWRLSVRMRRRRRLIVSRMNSISGWRGRWGQDRLRSTCTARRWRYAGQRSPLMSNRRSGGRCCGTVAGARARDDRCRLVDARVILKREFSSRQSEKSTRTMLAYHRWRWRQNVRLSRRHCRLHPRRLLLTRRRCLRFRRGRGRARIRRDHRVSLQIRSSRQV